MSTHDDVRDGLAEAFDALTGEFLESVAVTLCKQGADSTDVFETVLTISSKRFFEFQDYRKKCLLEIADDSSDLTTAMATTTHFKIGSVVYVVNAADTTPPQSTDVTWKLYGEKFEKSQHYSPMTV